MKKQSGTQENTISLKNTDNTGKIWKFSKGVIDFLKG